MKKLTGRMLAIAVGNSDLSIEMSHKYREIYAEQGYELPEFNPRGFRPGKKSLPINRLGLPGSELKKSLAWIESLKPATATCSCNNLAAEMDTDGFMKCRERREYYVGRMLENKTAIVEAMKSEGGVNGILGAVAGVVPHMIAVAWIGHKFDAACDAAEVKAKPKARPTRPTRPRRRAAGKHFIPHGPKVEEHPLPDDVRKNLIYHVYPMKQTQWLWQWNLDQIIQRIDLFNGRRVVAIVHDGNSDHPDAVKEYLHGHDCEFIVEKNSRKGESVTAAKLMEAVKSFEHEVTFRAHAKGVSKVFGKLQKQQAAATLAENGETVHKWTEIMYATCLDDWETVRDQLGRFAMTGPYRRNKRLGKAEWYFSGSFYWYHHVDFYQRRWQDISAARTGVESLPGQLFKASEVGCLHDDNCGSLYHYTYMRDTAWPAFEEWKRQRED